MATITKKELLEALDIGNAKCKDLSGIQDYNEKSKLIKTTYKVVEALIRFAKNEDEISGSSFAIWENTTTPCERLKVLLESSAQNLEMTILNGIETDVKVWVAINAPGYVHQTFSVQITKRQRICLFVLIGILFASAIAAVIATIVCSVAYPDPQFKALEKAASIIGVTDMTCTIVALVYERWSDLKKKTIGRAEENLRSGLSMKEKQEINRKYLRGLKKSMRESRSCLEMCNDSGNGSHNVFTEYDRSSVRGNSSGSQIKDDNKGEEKK